MFGEDVAPNHRKLATEFVLLDNFYATGGNSGDGHQWVTQASETSYELWPGYVGRSYPFEGTDPIAYANTAFCGTWRSRADGPCASSANTQDVFPRPSRGQAALDTFKMRFDVPDAAPTGRLNRILWGVITGWDVPYPGVQSAMFAPLAIDLDDDERGEDGRDEDDR